MIKTEENYISVKQVAKITGKSTYQIRNWIRNGELPAKKFPETKKGRWYINESDIPTFLKK